MAFSTRLLSIKYSYRINNQTVHSTVYIHSSLLRRSGFSTQYFLFPQINYSSSSLVRTVSWGADSLFVGQKGFPVCFAVLRHTGLRSRAMFFRTHGEEAPSRPDTSAFFFRASRRLVSGPSYPGELTFKRRLLRVISAIFNTFHPYIQFASFAPNCA